MFKRIAAIGFAGWAGIVSLAWWLADQRIELCDSTDERCILRATAARDTILVGGLVVALAGALIVLTFLARSGRLSGVRVLDAAPKPPSWQAPTRAELVVMADEDHEPRFASASAGYMLAFAKASMPLILLLLALLAAAVFQARRTSPPAMVGEAAPTENVSAGAYDNLIPKHATREAWQSAPLAQRETRHAGQDDPTVKE